MFVAMITLDSIELFIVQFNSLAVTRFTNQKFTHTHVGKISQCPFQN